MSARVQTDFWSGKRVFVTGHTGFKGGWLTTILDSLGSKVYGFALNPPSKKNFFNEVGIKKILKQDIRNDIRDVNLLKKKIKKISPDIIIHLAALAGVRPSFDNPELYYDVNVNGTRNMLEFAEANTKHILYASSSNAYEWWGNPYAATKIMNEIQCEDYSAIGMRFHTIWPGRDDMLFMKFKNNQVKYMTLIVGLAIALTYFSITQRNFTLMYCFLIFWNIILSILCILVITMITGSLSTSVLLTVTVITFLNR